MKLCANITLLYPELPFIERFGAAAADGFKAVEIQFPTTRRWRLFNTNCSSIICAACSLTYLPAI